MRFSTKLRFSQLKLYLILSCLIFFANAHCQDKSEPASPRTKALIAKFIHGAGVIIPLKFAALDKDYSIPLYMLTAFTSSACYIYLNSNEDFWNQSFKKFGLHAVMLGMIYLSLPKKRETELITAIYKAMISGILIHLYLLIEWGYIVYDDYKKVDYLTKYNAISSRIDIFPDFNHSGFSIVFSF
ncbi:MAG: hypothetical protein KDD94_01880 [Calditrichaeota bacterium]|nr:hypothetical protein [Calditrichota bacterium]